MEKEWRKSLGLFFIVLFLISFFSIVVHAENIPGMPVDLDKYTQGVDEALNKDQGLVQNPGVALNKDWAVSLDEKTSGIMSIVLAISNFLEVFNPFYKVVLGMEYSLSFAFAFGVAIWLFFIFILYPIASGLFKNRLFGFVGAFCIASLIGLAGIIKRAVDLFSIITSTKLLWVTLLVFVVILILMFIFRDAIKKWTKEEKAEQVEKDKAILHTEAENIKAKYEAIKNKPERT